MVRSLSDEQIEEIRRLFHTKRYTKRQLSIMYHCSEPTIALWLPRNNLIRIIKFKKSNDHKKKNRGLCLKCGINLKIHRRCGNCEILLHTDTCDCQLQKPYLYQK